ncbi:MAG: protein phosphatase 2C domain-containing protein [Pyrinomonadaceae bacterium]
MMPQTKVLKVVASAVSDRGLSQKRPVNEDSYLVDEEHGIFVVADGVGGAQAGDIASQTAVEVLADAFQHRGHDNGDVEDLMEIAIQRANAGIHQMSLEHSKLAMMATTIVALHTDGIVATIGHVGDSRLYRLAPNGELHRETGDHSMVEDEVRAGRLTPEQAVNHPGRNVISRALGAEDSVEVDLKTREVEEGTVFLLCSDGITRHVSDIELRELLVSVHDAPVVCAELKRLCYERGAEDNLTAVVVQIGERADSSLPYRPTIALVEDDDAELTLSSMVRPAASALPATPLSGEASKRPFSKVVVTPFEAESKVNPLDNRRSSLVPLLLLLLPLIGVGAFYGGLMFERQKNQPESSQEVSAPAMSTAVESLEAKYEIARREVDRAPQEMALKMERDSNGEPLLSTDPEFLYLYGRSLMLSGRHREAVNAFQQTISRLDANSAAGMRDPLRIEARISTAAAALKANDPQALERAVKELDEVITSEQR